MVKIGIFGGSFNPIHNAHISFAADFYSKLSLDKLLFIPSYQSPFKERNDYQIDDFHRIKMLELAIDNFPKYDIELFEIMKNETSYTIDTLKFLNLKYSESKFFLLIGSDQSVKFHKWKNWQEILLKSQLCIANRNNEKIYFDNNINEFLIKNNIKIEYLNNEEIDISSTKIRELIKKNIDISNLVPRKVTEYIKLNNLYV